MATRVNHDRSEAETTIKNLLDSSPPVLVEVRFPNCGTSSDWFLCEDEDDLEQVVQRLGPGAELHVSSVWDLKNPKGDIRLGL